MKSLSELMKERHWEQDWPVGIQAAQAMPTDWAGAQGLPEQSAAVAQLLAGHTAHPTVVTLRRTLADIDAWNEWAQHHLTYPPTARAMGTALVQGLSEETGRIINDLTRQVVGLYPALSWAAFEVVADTLGALPEKLRAEWWPKPAVEPKPAPSTPEPAEASVAAPAPNATRSAAGRNHAARWIRDQLLPIARSKKSAPLLLQEMDEAIKHHFNATARPDWAEDVLLPSLMALTGDELADLMPHWPPAARYPLAKPIDTMSKPKFWAQLRDAEPAAQKILVTTALKQVIQSDDWSTEDRLRMLRQMLGFVRTNRDGFEQRVELWKSWGGNLHEKGVLARDRAEEAETSAFGTSAAAKSGLDWIAEQPHEMWKAWVADQAAAERRPAQRRGMRTP